MDKRTVGWGAGILLIAVVLGAFGAHGLKPLLTPDALGQWRTGVEYQFYHGIGLLVIGFAGDRLRNRNLRILRGLFVVGIVLFSGSLYLIALRQVLGAQALTSLAGPLTPLGGLAFIAGWCWLLVTALRAPSVP
ncbi:MAG: DUF423 domain-containing protein [Flavobacteriales bacterium]